MEAPMANGFHGYRYAVDAKDSRQYAISFVNGSPRKPFHVFAEDDRQGGFKPNEVIFAFDDEREFERRGAVNVISTTAYQIHIDRTAEPAVLKHTGVDYQV